MRTRDLKLDFSGVKSHDRCLCLCAGWQSARGAVWSRHHVSVGGCREVHGSVRLPAGPHPRWNVLHSVW